MTIDKTIKTIRSLPANVQMILFQRSLHPYIEPIMTDDLKALCDEVERLHIALCDAIRSPMGVMPDSAQGLVSAADLVAAEKRWDSEV
jgi:hypothetical protein